MSENSKIQWCDHTFNPWEGCTRISPGCANCYAEARNHRFGGGNWGKGKPRRRTSAANWKQPLKWNRDYEAEVKSRLCGTANEDEGVPVPRRPRVFCASLADWLDNEVPIGWLADLLKLIHDTPNLDWLLLTKRPGWFHSRIAQVCEYHRPSNPIHPDAELVERLNRWSCRNQPPHNIWIGASAEDQKRADERIPELLNIPARVRFLSVEPMLSPIDFTLALPWNPEHEARKLSSPVLQSQILRKTKIPGVDWVILGGESGPNARPCNVEWIRDGIAQCRSAGVRVFVKQLGRIVTIDHPKFEGDEHWIVKLKDPKGGDMAEWPEDLRIREFPIA